AVSSYIGSVSSNPDMEWYAFISPKLVRVTSQQVHALLTRYREREQFVASASEFEARPEYQAMMRVHSGTDVPPLSMPRVSLKNPTPKELEDGSYGETRYAARLDFSRIGYGANCK